MEEKIVVEDYENFKVYSLDKKYSFFHIEINDDLAFYDKMFEYFFDEHKLIGYTENNSDIKFTPTIKNFVTLYKALSNYIDDLYDNVDIKEIDTEVVKILKEEYEVNDGDEGCLKVRLDKMGKIGEYMFYCILKSYFGFDCIIPKVQLTTNRNMSVYGIDALFYCKDKDMILFGESKLSNTLENGIVLIKKSLSSYENSLKNEYVFTLSNRTLKDKLNMFDYKYGNISEQCIDIEDFIKKANIDKIGIPVFIAHGSENKIEDIMKNLNRISEKNLLGLNTIYYFISLPIINKSKFISVFTRNIKERRDKYESEYRKM